MSAMLRIAFREVRERRFLLAAVLVPCLLARGLRVFEGPESHGFGELLSLLLMLSFPPAAALAVGGSLVGRDLAERRLSFYFSRPLSAGTLWAGKFLGGAALVLGAFACVNYVAIGISRGLGPEAVVLWILGLLFLLALSHVISTMYRSGSPVIALDLVLGTTCLAILVAQVRRLDAAGAGWVVVNRLVPVALAVATAILLAAGLAQLARGRIEARRGHRALSVTLWTLALLGLGALGVWSSWLQRVAPVDAGGVGYPLLLAPNGNALFFKGASDHGRAGFSPFFLMDGESGSFVRLAPERVTPPAFAASGKVAAWVASGVPWWWHAHLYSGDRSPLDQFDAEEAVRRGTTLALARFDRGTPVIDERPLDLPDPMTAALAVDGTQVLLAGRSSVALLDAASGRPLATTPLSHVLAADLRPGGWVRLFVQETTDRGRAALVVIDWNAKDGSRVERVRARGETAMRLLLARGGDLAVISTGAQGKALLDAHDGAVREFSYSTADVPGAALVLSSGTVALSLGEELRIVSRAGLTVASVSIGPRTQVYALREPAPGELAVGLWTPSYSGRRTLFLDATTGAVRREEKGVLPAGPRYGPWSSPEPGSFASRLVTDLDGALIVLEPDGRRREIVRAGR